jgi:hypothetical protein
LQRRRPVHPDDRCEDGVCVADLVVCPEPDPCKSGSCDPRP